MSIAHQNSALAGVSGGRVPGVPASTVWRILSRNGLKSVDDALEPGRRRLRMRQRYGQHVGQTKGLLVEFSR